jgi:GNAT superfamily N-acetyltransferase
MSDLVVKPLTEATWPDFERLVEAHNGVWGGCWCMALHPARDQSRRNPAANEEDKSALVKQGDAHAALVYDDGGCAGWCQFGPTAALPRIKHRRAYEASATRVPDWRITCFFVARTHRRAGVADTALAGALTEIERLGGGTVESYPQ